MTIFFYLSNNEFSTSSKDFTKWGINFFMQNSTNGISNISWTQFQNWFMGESEGQDGLYDANLDNLLNNTSFQQQSLPSFSQFLSVFPKIQRSDMSGYYDQAPSSIVYNNYVKGTLLNLYNATGKDDGNYGNTCAIRASYALNQLGITIPKKQGITEQGEAKNGIQQNYILTAKSMNKFLLDSFGETPYKLEATGNTPLDANNPETRKTISDLLKGKNGIYVIVNWDANKAGYTGHASFIQKGLVGGTACLFPPGGIKSIRVWALP